MFSTLDPATLPAAPTPSTPTPHLSIRHLELIGSFRPVIPVIHYIFHYARNLTGISGVTYIKKSIDLAWSSLTGISGVTYIKNLPLPLLSSPSWVYLLGGGLMVEPPKALLISRAPSPVLSLTVEPPKGTESLTIHMVRVLISRAPSPLPLLNCRVPKGPMGSSASGPYGRAPTGPLLKLILKQ
jgi:hypothetical protein